MYSRRSGKDQMQESRGFKIGFVMCSVGLLINTTSILAYRYSPDLGFGRLLPMVIVLIVGTSLVIPGLYLLNENDKISRLRKASRRVAETEKGPYKYEIRESEDEE